MLDSCLYDILVVLSQFLLISIHVVLKGGYSDEKDCLSVDSSRFKDIARGLCAGSCLRGCFKSFVLFWMMLKNTEIRKINAKLSRPKLRCASLITGKKCRLLPFRFPMPSTLYTNVSCGYTQIAGC